MCDNLCQGVQTESWYRSELMLEGRKETDGFRTAQPPKRRNSGTTLQVLFTVSQTGMNEVCVTTDKGDASNKPVTMLDIARHPSNLKRVQFDCSQIYEWWNVVWEIWLKDTGWQTGFRDDNITCRIIWLTRFVLFPQCFRLPFRIWLTQLLFGQYTVETCHNRYNYSRI